MLKLFRHQEMALNYLRLNDAFMLCMEQGTGKTLPTLSRLLELFNTRQITNALVVCPKSVIASWERDIEKFTPKQQEVLKKITIVNYDKVWRWKEFDIQWDCIVLDEAHSIKNRTSKRASFLLKKAVDSKYRYLLTGTPISNGQLENVWSLMCFLDAYRGKRGQIYSRIFAEEDGGNGSYYEWLDKYAFLDQYHNPYKYHNVDHLQRIINSYSFRVTKAQCLDLPQKLDDEIITIELPKSVQKLYKDIFKQSASIDYDYVAENPLVRLTKLRQICSGWFVDDKDEMHEFECEKIDALGEFLDGFDKKLVIFAEYKKSIKAISELLMLRGVSYVILDGEQKDKGIWRKFQADESIQVIICQYQSGCQGIDLYASDTMLFYEPTLRSNVLEQGKDRIHRNGQHHPCSYIHFLTKGTIEERIYKALKGYADFSNKMFIEYMKEYQRSHR